MRRVSVDVEEALLRRVMGRYGLEDERETVEMALGRLDIRPMTRAEALAMQGSGWEGNLDDLRSRPRPVDPLN